MTTHPATPSQTVGPFFHDCLLRPDACGDVVGADEDRDVVHVSGRVLDGDAVGVPDAVLEVWQPGTFTRVGTDEQGRFSFAALRPGALRFDDTTPQAPHLSVAVFARGLLNHLLTRIYFEDEPSTMADPILGHVPEARRPTLIARLDRSARLTRSYRFDIVLQGADETVFFDFRSRVR